MEYVKKTLMTEMVNIEREKKTKSKEKNNQMVNIIPIKKKRGFRALINRDEVEKNGKLQKPKLHKTISPQKEGEESIDTK